MTENSEIEAALEAVLFVAAEPVDRAKLLEVFGSQDRAAATAALERVIERYGGGPDKGIRIDPSCTATCGSSSKCRVGPGCPWQRWKRWQSWPTGSQ